MNKKTFIKNFLIVAVVAAFLFISNKVLLADDPIKGTQTGCSGGMCPLGEEPKQGCSWDNVKPQPLPTFVPPVVTNLEGKPQLSSNLVGPKSLQGIGNGEEWAKSIVSPHEGRSAKGASMTQAATGPYGLGVVAQQALDGLNYADAMLAASNAAKAAGDLTMAAWYAETASIYYAQAQAYDTLIFQPIQQTLDEGSAAGLKWQTSDFATYTPLSGVANVVGLIVPPVSASTLGPGAIDQAMLASALQAVMNPGPGVGMTNTIGHVQLGQFVNSYAQQHPGLLTMNTGITTSYAQAVEYMTGLYSMARFGYYTPEWSNNNPLGYQPSIMQANIAFFGKPTVGGPVSNFGEYYNPLNNWGTQVTINHTTYVYDGSGWVNRSSGKIADSLEQRAIYASMWTGDRQIMPSYSAKGLSDAARTSLIGLGYTLNSTATAWVPPGGSGTTSGLSPISADRLTQADKSELIAKGWTLNPSTNTYSPPASGGKSTPIPESKLTEDQKWEILSKGGTYNPQTKTYTPAPNVGSVVLVTPGLGEVNTNPNSGPVGYGNVNPNTNFAHTSFGDFFFAPDVPAGVSRGTLPTGGTDTQSFFDITGVTPGNSGSSAGNGAGGVVATGSQVDAALEAAYGFTMESYGPASQTW